MVGVCVVVDPANEMVSDGLVGLLPFIVAEFPSFGWEAGLLDEFWLPKSLFIFFQFCKGEKDVLSQLFLVDYLCMSNSVSR